jgi:hypothetical protein
VAEVEAVLIRSFLLLLLPLLLFALSFVHRTPAECSPPTLTSQQALPRTLAA